MDRHSVGWSIEFLGRARGLLNVVHSSVQYDLTHGGHRGHVGRSTGGRGPSWLGKAVASSSGIFGHQGGGSGPRLDHWRSRLGSTSLTDCHEQHLASARASITDRLALACGYGLGRNAILGVYAGVVRVRRGEDRPNELFHRRTGPSAHYAVRAAATSGPQNRPARHQAGRSTDPRRRLLKANDDPKHATSHAVATVLKLPFTEGSPLAKADMWII
jgi:hypothetical protein